METIVLLMCGKHKLSYKAKAKEMYTSPRFQESILYAKTLTSEKNIYILSAKHGLLELEKKIFPYNKSIYDMPIHKKEKWAKKVIKQISKVSNLNEDRYIFLTDDDYCSELYPVLKNVVLPLKGLNQEEHLEFFTKAMK